MSSLISPGSSVHSGWAGPTKEALGLDSSQRVLCWTTFHPFSEDLSHLGWKDNMSPHLFGCFLIQGSKAVYFLWLYT